MELILLYLWLKLDTFGFALGVVILVFGVAVLVFLVFTEQLFCQRAYSPTKDETAECADVRKIARKWGWVLVFGLLPLFLLMPSSKQVAILVGASYALDLSKSPEGQKVVTLIRAKANQLLDEQIKAPQPAGK